MRNFKLMKFSLIILLLFIHTLVSGQGLIGKYLTPEGYRLEIKKDSTFYFDKRYCTSISWQQGQWSTYKDTIVFQPMTVYDTIYCNGQDSIVLSWDIHSSKISCDSFTTLSNLGMATYQLSGR